MKRIIKCLYNFIPFKKYFFDIIKHSKLQESFYKHFHFKGVFKVKVDKSNSFKLFHYGYQIENNIYWEGLYGKYEKTSLKIWSEISKKSNIVFDIGANTGIFALVAQTVNPNAEVYAFEPIERVYNKLVLNNKINNFDIKCYKLALSETNGRIKVFDQPLTHETTVSLERNVLESAENSQLVEIEKINLKSFIEMNQLRKIDLIKMDVEYHEYSVLKGMEEYLEKYRPNILLEIVDEEIAEKINELIKKLNYVIYDINEHTFSINKINKIQKSSFCNLLIYKNEQEVELIESLKGEIKINS